MSTEVEFRGELARQVLENPEFKRATDDVRLALLDAIAKTAPPDAVFREFLYSCVRTLPFIDDVLMARLNGGVFAAQERIAAELEARKLGI